MAGRLILDSGALIGWQRGDRKIWGYLAEAAERGTSVVVPAVVLTECIRGGSRDAAIHRLVTGARVPFIGKRVAVQAGRLLGRAGMSATVDALVAAEAIRGGPCIVLTSDPGDLGTLLDKTPYVRVVGV